MQKLIVSFFVLIITFTYGQQDILDHRKTEYHILFIGNSLTYTNDLPKLVKKRAKLQEISIKTQMIAFPNYAIEDHWNEGNVQKLISSNTFDFVIIQQGPSSQDEGRQMLIDYGKKFKDLCELNNAQLCYFMVWPSLSYYGSFDAVIKNHEDAATLNNSILLPVGRVWKDYFDSAKSYEYYGADGFHPSLAGSKVAADVIVDYLFKE